jgi:L-alanine-DL-glutamate epimerase-like enolase superfamily enzyme
VAESFDVPVCPHFLLELPVSVAAAVPNGHLVEHIPQPRAVASGEITSEAGHAGPPNAPGLGID